MWPKAGFAGREAMRDRACKAKKEGAGGGTMGSPALNDHGLHTREPAIGRQIQGVPLA
jgi:hypothetical protein